MSRRQSGITVALCLCAAGLVFATIGAADPGRLNGQAIQFGIGSEFTLGNFGDATLAYQRFIGRDVAWRTSVGLNLRYDDGSRSVEYDGPNPFDGSKDQGNWDHTVSVTSEWLWYHGTTLAVFFGCGPRVVYSNYRYERWDYYLHDRQWLHERDRSRQVAAGVQGCLGVQWAAVEWLALHAEYDARAMYLHAVAETEEYYRNEAFKERVTTDRLSFQSPGVRFGLSVYF